MRATERPQLGAYMVAQGAQRLPVHDACPSAQLNTLRNLCKLHVLHPTWWLEAGVAVCIYGMPLKYPNSDVVISDLSSPCVLGLVQAGAPPAGR